MSEHPSTRATCKSACPQKPDQQLVHTLRRVTLDPMTRLWEPFDADVGDPSFEALGEAEAKIAILLSPDKQGGNIDAADGTPYPQRITAKKGAVIIDTGGEDTRLGKGFLIALNICFSECTAMYWIAAQNTLKQGVASGTKAGLRQPGE